MSRTAVVLARRRGLVRSWILIALLLALALGLIAGLLYAVSVAMAGGSDRGSTSAPAVAPTANGKVVPGGAHSGQEAAADLLASRPMLQLPPSAALPQPLVSASAGPSLALPRATDMKQLVPTGFPRTPEGAAAQLAAIDSLAWLNATPEQARQVYSWSVAPGAVSLTDWTPYVGVNSLLQNAGQPAGSSELRTTFTPTHVQIKGVLNGGDFVVACVLGEFAGTYQSATKVGVGDCQRLIWDGKRWRIGPGAQPAFAPSAWPGSADCVRAGWRSIADA